MCEKPYSVKTQFMNNEDELKYRPCENPGFPLTRV